MPLAAGAGRRFRGGGRGVPDSAERACGRDAAAGRKNFKIAAVLKQEPDRMTAGAGLGPRVMISRAALEETGLLAPGSRASASVAAEAAGNG